MISRRRWCRGCQEWRGRDDFIDNVCRFCGTQRVNGFQFDRARYPRRGGRTQNMGIVKCVSSDGNDGNPGATRGQGS